MRPMLRRLTRCSNEQSLFRRRRPGASARRDAASQLALVWRGGEPPLRTVAERLVVGPVAARRSLGVAGVAGGGHLEASGDRVNCLRPASRPLNETLPRAAARSPR